MTVSPVVSVMDTHPSLVVSQVVPPLGVPRGPVEKLAPEHHTLVTAGWCESIIKGSFCLHLLSPAQEARVTGRYGLMFISILGFVLH